ncbi:PP2C family protein-serine/threonine phosphatase [Sediminitomix flava]|uniref:Serine phosphatase RsbU (Regulator of sigma subunit) n=1 Tax=Sediminitomix flava TaxID=379075 RepID=A0A315Z872_SEDFL|nr:SpoIIE family protein phosphatase [Sediminitomix flava]PWJ40755.1 serine phosphatase RsbU (regulator of sigma subunit) [Sediminitomix flava]
MPNSNKVLQTYDLSNQFESDQELKKAGLLDNSLLSLGGASSLHILFFYLTKNTTGAIITASFAVTMFCILLLSKRGLIPFRMLKTLYPLLLHLLVMSIIVITGGLASPFIIWYGIVFSVSYFYGSLRKGVMWVIIGLIHISAIGLIDFLDVWEMKNYGLARYYTITNYYSAFLMLLYLGKAFYQYEQWHINSQLELTDLNDEVIAQNEELQQHKEEIQTQNERLEKSQTTLISSLNYGRKIQSTLLNFQFNLKNSFDESFVFQRPRDIVSGDFYWCKEIDNKVIVVVADCTGHGIPSAFLTIIGATNLNQTVTGFGLTDPSKVLKSLDNMIIQDLNQDRDEGMDMGIIVLDKTNGNVTYSGANTPLYLIRNSEIEQIKGTRAPLGDTKIKDKSFENIKIQLQKGDQLYLASDGFQDQFGGPNDRKYLKKRFREMLLKYSDLPMNRQKMKIEQEFTQWKNTQKQTDDILVLGIKY